MDRHQGQRIDRRVTVTTRTGKDLPAKIVGVAEDHDLAMLKVDAKGLTPVTWGDPAKAEVGQFLASAGTTDVPVAVGVLSVARRKIPAHSGMIGVALGDAEGGAKILQVVPDSPAEKAGLKVDDVITKLNDKMVSSRDELVSAVHRFSPGQEVTLEVRRGDKHMDVKATLASAVGAATRAETMNRMGGPLSGRSANFPAVLQHDTVLTPTQCGGPVVTLDGKAIGVNIARAGRVESYALPADVIQSLLPNLKSGKLAPAAPTTKPTTKPAEESKGDRPERK